VGYHVVYSIAIPILLTELLFPARKAEPWLRSTGLTVTGVLFTLAALGLGVVFRLFVAPSFRTPLPQAIGAALTVIGLVALALRLPAERAVDRSDATPRWAPSPRMVGLLAFLAASAWFELLFLPHALRTGAGALLPLISGAALAAGATALLRRWSDRNGVWTDLHRLALVLGVLPPMMLFGYFLVTVNNRVDQVGQGIASVVTLGLLTGFALHLRRRSHAGAAGQPAGRPGGSQPVPYGDTGPAERSPH
jgi:hypothetical protein